MSHIAELIAVGTELLLGSISNTDGQMLSQGLSALGINVYYHTVVGDNPQRLKAAIELAKTRSDIIITTGGLGPTCDDLTKNVLAECFGKKLIRDEESARRIEAYFKALGRSVTENNYQQAMLPEGCTILANDWGTAPGVAFEAGGIHVVMLPGPPRECRAMFEHRAVRGAMLTGLCALEVSGDQIINVIADDMDADDLDDCMDRVGDFDDFEGSNKTLFYFGNDEDHDGAMKTGSVTINLDGDSYSFQFSKAGGAEGKGRGLTGVEDGKYIYKNGLKLKAESDEKYIVVGATGDIGDSDAKVREFDSADLRSAADPAGQNKDGDTVKVLAFKAQGDQGIVSVKWPKELYLLNTSGSIVKNKTAAKDGDDWYFYVDDKNIAMYTNNKTLKDLVALEGWKDWALSTVNGDLDSFDDILADDGASQAMEY